MYVQSYNKYPQRIDILYERKCEDASVGAIIKNGMSLKSQADDCADLQIGVAFRYSRYGEAS